jgi:hypothetical protein
MVKRLLVSRDGFNTIEGDRLYTKVATAGVQNHFLQRGNSFAENSSFNKNDL